MIFNANTGELEPDELPQRVDLKEEREKLSRSRVEGGKLIDPLKQKVKVRSKAEEDRAAKQRKLQAPRIDEEARSAASESFLSQFLAPVEPPTPLPLGERLRGNITQGLKETATGLYALPARMLESQVPDREITQRVLGGYGQSVNELTRKQAERRARLGALPEGASTAEKVLSIGSQVAGDIVPLVALSATGAGPVLGIGAQAALQGVGRNEDPTETLLNVGFGIASGAAGMGVEKLAKVGAGIALPKDTFTSRVARQVLGRSATGGAGLVASDIENELRGIKGHDAQVNRLTNALTNALFFSAKLKKGEGQEYRAKLKEAVGDRPLTKNLVDAAMAFLDDEAGQADITKGAERINNLMEYLKESKVKTPEGDPIPVYHGTQSPTEIEQIDVSKLNPEALYGPGFYTTQDPNVAAGDSGYAATKQVNPARSLTNSELKDLTDSAEILDLWTRGNGDPKTIIEQGNSWVLGTVQWRGGIEKVQQKYEELQAIKQGSNKPHAYKLYLNIKNPFDADAMYPPEVLTQILRAATGNPEYPEFYGESSGNSIYHTWLLAAVGRDKVRANQVLKDLGYDGITHIGGSITGGKPHKVWIAFDSEQVKSATGNKGTFDPKSPRLSEAQYGEEGGELPLYNRRSNDTATPEEFQRAAAKAGLGPLNDWVEFEEGIGKELKGIEYLQKAKELNDNVWMEIAKSDRGKGKLSESVSNLNPDLLRRIRDDLELELDDQYKMLKELKKRKESGWDVQQDIADLTKQIKENTQQRLAVSKEYEEAQWGFAQKTIKRWGVPNWNPSIDGGRAVDRIDDVRYETKVYSDGARVYTNSVGMALLKTLEQKIFEDFDSYESLVDKSLLTKSRYIPGGIAGETLLFDDITREAVALLDDPKYGKAALHLIKTFDFAVRQATARNQQGLSVINLDDMRYFKEDSDRSLRSVIRHESAHQWQYDIGGPEGDGAALMDLDWFMKQPFHKMLVAGLQDRYRDIANNPRALAMESIAHLAAGQFSQMKMTAEQGGDVLGKMLLNIVERHGIAALDKLRVDPKLKGVIDDIRRENGSSTKGVVSRESAGSVDRGVQGGLRSAIGSSASSPGRVLAAQFSNIDTEFSPPGIRERIKARLKGSGLPFKFSFFDHLKTEVLDSMYPVIKAWNVLVQDEDSVVPSDNARYLMRNWLGVSGKVGRVLEKGMIDGEDNIVLPGGIKWLMEPWEGLPKKQIEEEAITAIHTMIAERTLELATKRMDLDMSKAITGVGDSTTDPMMADIIASIRKLKEVRQSGDLDKIARIDEAAKRYREWGKSLLDYAHDKGRLSDAAYNQILENGELYVDLHRLFDESPDAAVDSSAKKYGKAKRILHKLQGSELKISNPYLNLLVATDQTIREVDRNQAMSVFTTHLKDAQDTAQSPDEQALLQSIGTRIATPSRTSVKVWDNGVQHNWEFHPEIDNALKGLNDPPKMQLLFKAISATVGLSRTMITHTPGFLARNLWRDSWVRPIISRANTTANEILNPLEGSKPWDPLTQTVRPLSKAMNDGYFLSGGSQAGHYLSSRIDYQARLRDAISDLSSDSSVILAMPGKLANFAWNELPSHLENVNRKAEFKAIYEKFRGQGMSDYDAKIKAGFEARDLMDFAVGGSAIKELNRYILFLNPAIQSLKRTTHAAWERPLPFALRWGMYALAPALGELYWNQQQGEETLEEWRALPGWRKDMFYNFKAGDDRWITLPKPFELGVAASFTNRLIDQYYLGNPHAFDDSWSQVKKSLVPIDDSAFMGPLRAVGEAVANYNTFYDEHIVSPFEEKRDPQLLRARGSAIGTAIAKVMETDPRYVDHVMRSWFSDYASIANYTGEMFNQELKPEEIADVRKKLIGLASGNVVRATKPDQTTPVKYVVKEAFSLYGERSDWYQPLKELIEQYRDATNKPDREDAAIKSVLYANRLRDMLPELRKRVLSDMGEVDGVLKQHPGYKDLDRDTQRVVESGIKSDLRNLDHKILSAKVKGNPLEVLGAEFERQSYSIPLHIMGKIFEATSEKTEKGLERTINPVVPERKQRQK